ncbi:MAG: NAD(P)-dependent alcohol dehydrogenase [Vicinamibacterales bacterium]
MLAYELHPNADLDALVEVDRPAAPLGPYDVRVRIRAVSLNYRDLAIARRAQKQTSRIIPCSDGAGVVVAVGPSVTRFKEGDRVAGIFFPDWVDGEFVGSYHGRALGGSMDGMLAEEVVLDERSWVALPPELSFEEGATLPCAGVTAYNALFESASVGPGATVLVQGTGGVSVFALQLAVAAGARVIATSSSDAKRERARQIGACHVIDYTTTQNWGDAAREWTGGHGVDVVVEVGGQGTFDQSVAALRYGGTMSLIGVLTGGRGEVNTYGVFAKVLHVRGIYVGSRRMFERLIRALTATGVRPVIDRVFPFDQAREAYQHVASGSHFGKVVVRVG